MQAKFHLLKRKDSSHKGHNGKVLIVGGSKKYTGAAILAGMAAYRAGADLVTIIAPDRAASAASYWPDFITMPIRGGFFRREHARAIIRLADDCDCLLIGNGIGRENTTMEFARRICQIEKKKVIDADAIKAISINDAQNAVITPHMNEYKILLKNSRTTEDRLRSKLGTNVVLVKGKVDRIITDAGVYENRTGNPGMTVGGTGDVLAGLCAGLIAQGNSLKDSAIGGAYINGIAGDNLQKKLGYGFTATDLADEIAVVMKKWQ